MNKLTNEEAYSLGKWLSNRGTVTRRNVPELARPLEPGNYKYFQVEAAKRDSDGYVVMSDDDRFYMSVACKDAYREESDRLEEIARNRRTYHIAVIALFLSVLSLLWQIGSWIAERIVLS